MHKKITAARRLSLAALSALWCVTTQARADATAIPTDITQAPHRESPAQRPVDATDTSADATGTPTNQPLAEATAVSTRAPSPAGGVVNINTASAEELERLPGVGPSRAQAILALRMRLKRFSRLEELLRVKGIGRATFRKLRPLLALQGDTTLNDKPRASH